MGAGRGGRRGGASTRGLAAFLLLPPVPHPYPVARASGPWRALTTSKPASWWWTTGTAMTTPPCRPKALRTWLSVPLLDGRVERPLAEAVSGVWSGQDLLLDDAVDEAAVMERVLSGCFGRQLALPRRRGTTTSVAPVHTAAGDLACPRATSASPEQLRLTSLPERSTPADRRADDPLDPAQASAQFLRHSIRRGPTWRAGHPAQAAASTTPRRTSGVHGGLTALSGDNHRGSKGEHDDTVDGQRSRRGHGPSLDDGLTRHRGELQLRRRVTV